MTWASTAAKAASTNGMIMAIQTHIQSLIGDIDSCDAVSLTHDAVLQLKNSERELTPAWIRSVVQRIVNNFNRRRVLPEVPLTKNVAKYCTSEKPSSSISELDVEVLNELSDSKKAILLLRADGNSYEKIGKLLGCTPPSALRMIREAQSDYVRILLRLDHPPLDRFLERLEDQNETR